MASLSYCVVCDALPGECAHTGPRYLDDVVYERVETDNPLRPMWRVPDSERERVDNPPRTWATITGKQEVADAEQHPFRCADCGATLSRVALLRGYVRCWKCQRKDTA